MFRFGDKQPYRSKNSPGSVSQIQPCANSGFNQRFLPHINQYHLAPGAHSEMYLMCVFDMYIISLFKLIALKYRTDKLFFRYTRFNQYHKLLWYFSWRRSRCRPFTILFSSKKLYNIKNPYNGRVNVIE